MVPKKKKTVERKKQFKYYIRVNLVFFVAQSVRVKNLSGTLCTHTQKKKKKITFMIVNAFYTITTKLDSTYETFVTVGLFRI